MTEITVSGDNESPQNLIPNASINEKRNICSYLKFTKYFPVINAELINHGAAEIVSLFIPVSICMLIVYLTAKWIPYFTTTDVFLVYAPFHTPHATVGTKTWQTIANVAIMVSVIVAVTFLLVCLFKYRWYKVLHFWILGSTIIIMFSLSFMFFLQLIRSLRMFVDIITFSFFLWNFAIFGLVSIHWRGPLLLQQGYLIFLSSQVALTFLKHLPQWTCWLLLAAIAFWDLIAVLCPHGPLRMLVQLSQERNHPLFPSLLYSTTATILVNVTTEASEPSANSTSSPELSNILSLPETEPIFQNPLEVVHDSDILLTADELSTQQQDSLIAHHTLNNFQSFGGSTELDSDVGQEESNKSINVQSLRSTKCTRSNDDTLDNSSRGVKLGLGDFIFYSLMLGRASLDGDILTVISCYMAILIGMCTTLVALGVVKRALPALPISVLSGILFYFTTASVISPFIEATSKGRVYF